MNTAQRELAFECLVCGDTYKQIFFKHHCDCETDIDKRGTVSVSVTVRMRLSKTRAGKICSYHVNAGGGG